MGYLGIASDFFVLGYFLALIVSTTQKTGKRIPVELQYVENTLKSIFINL